MGISRSSAAMALILAQARPDRPAADALVETRRIRRRIWPNLRVVELGDALLGRRGTLIAAAVARYRHVLERRPEMALAMQQLGRGREVEAAEAAS
jgi:predicted protein tyrosine phosphatase